MPYCSRKGLKRSLTISPESIRRASFSNVSISSRMAEGIGSVRTATLVVDSWLIVTSDVIHEGPLLFELALLTRELFDCDRIKHIPFRRADAIPHLRE